MSARATTIRGFLCEIEPNDGRGGVNCYISKGRFSASLGCAMDNGWLDGIDDSLPISEDALAEIEAWANRHGYSD